ncbi:elongation factor P maturation arginine rhamnosyltransferase EarP [Acidovorax sp. SUPP3334]|uniref:elongation factor P maturation arginine rhamnosyltransferase EarP n=1 Tax=Acidovorax sp. SUPP3334 TaxID=2920881 RepID=UPI0023DE4210|nr:elongation factor P maturation arginine rhamnosyltransferase EarP [Acidovorax sp. SUPP3334]GKT22802.1 elongation factor P maturation arginine rhamnosyltransferase EarP [Acidovorax sp. SUPP3334]
MNPTSTVTPPLRWDLFCQVIDNYGDIGVCWRLAADLGTRGHSVRLWTDDPSALAWMAPDGAPGVQVLPWPAHAPPDGPGDVVLEAFGCEIAPDFIASIADPRSAGGQKSLWINLEYLSAEPYVERSHRLPSLLMSGPGAGCTRWFFYPGFTERTGGLLREPGLMARQRAFDRGAWRARKGVAADALAVSLFCYEPPALPQMLGQLQQRPGAHLLVTPGRAAAAVRALENVSPIDLQRNEYAGTLLSISYLTPCPQPAFDEMLWACDLNCVRGEDSLVRALWAGQPLVWHIYPQDDDSHHAKLQAFLDWLQAPPSLRRFHAIWNGIERGGPLPALDTATLQEWCETVQAARARLLAQDDLLTQLLGFVAEKS